MAEAVVSVATRVSIISDDSSAFNKCVRTELGALHSDLAKMQDHLIEVEQKKDNQLVRSCFTELGRMAYEAEDIVDTFVLNGERFFKWAHASHRAFKQLRSLRSRMLDVKSKLDTHQESSTGLMVKRSGEKRFEASHDHLDSDHDVVGIDSDVDRLVKRLLAKKSAGDQPPPPDILAIEGMGGSGKTTLARKIYNHQAVKKHFKFQAWVSLFQASDALDVMFDILDQATWGDRNRTKIVHTINYEGHNLDTLVSRLQNLLKGKTCLVVLDNVWEADLKSLNQILPVLSHQLSAGVKIIITSRKHFPSLDNRFHWYFHQTQCLDKEDSWKLLSKLAKKHKEEYKVLAMDMMRKCEGLPLAIVALGKFLETKETIEDWEKVLSKIEGVRGNDLYQHVKNILALSYNKLPYYLKPCFLYLGVFPEGSIISAGKLIRMWIAEGFVHQRQDEETLEDAARERLQELIEHNIVQVVRKNYAGEVKAVQVHILMRDLCVMKAHDVDFMTTFFPNSEGTNMYPRRAAVSDSLFLHLPIQNPHLRSLLLFEHSNIGSRANECASKGREATLNLVLACKSFKLLRVLVVSGITTVDGTMPTQIGGLIHLRHLRIRSTNIRELPRSIGKLRNLLTLDYGDVFFYNEIIVPNVLCKLKRLRHLYLPDEMSSGMEDLKLDTNQDLQVLWGVRGGNWMLSGMKNMCSTLRKLGILGISKPEQLEAVLHCPVIKTSNCLHALALRWDGFDLENLDCLDKKHNLKKLKLMGTIHTLYESRPLRFPSNLQKLELHHTQIGAPETMAVLGQLQHLKFLSLSKDSFVGSEWTCDSEAFPNLEKLKLSNLPKLAAWKIEKGIMPCLKKLSIVSCLKMERMPEGLKFIRALQKLKIERMPRGFCCGLRQGEDFQLIQHIPCVIVRSHMRHQCGLLFTG